MKSLALSALALLAFVAAASAVNLEIEIPAMARMGEPLAVAVHTGSEAGNLEVVLFYRGVGAPDYTRSVMLADAGGRHTATIPASATRSPELRYWVDATSQDGATMVRLGSPERPLPLLLREVAPASAQSSLMVKAAILFLPLAGFGGWLRWRERRRRERLLDRLFWYKKLAPLLRLEGRVVGERAEQIAASTLAHPVDGEIRCTREQVLDRLEVVRGDDAAQLETERKRYLGREWDSLAVPFEPAQPAMKVPSLEEQLTSLVARLGRCSASAWFRAHTRGPDGSTSQESVQPTMEALEALRRARAALKAGDTDAAAQLVAAVTEDASRLEQALSRAEARVTPEELAHRLSSARSLTGDDLGRLLEFHLITAPRTATGRRKAVEIGLTLCERDSVDPTSPDNVARSIARRKLLQQAGKDRFSEDAGKRAVALREEIHGTTVSDASAMKAIYARLEAWEESIGRGFYTLRGISEAVAIAASIRARVVEAERRTLASLDLYGAELFEEPRAQNPASSATMEFIVNVVEDPKVAAHLAAVERLLREAVAKDDCECHGFYLEEVELLAARPKPAHPRWAGLVVRAAACRTATDQLARRHARSSQPEGSEPPPLPEDLAHGLVRAAIALETDLQDQIQRDLRHGESARARETARLVHRLSRARIGLAVLGEFNPNGLDEATLWFAADDADTEPVMSGNPTARGRA